MPQTKIAGIGYYVPENVFTNTDLTQFMDTSDEWIQERTGIKERRYAHRTNETTTTMAVEASKIAIARAGIHAVFTGELLRIISFIFLAPVIGLIVSFILTVILSYVCRYFIPQKVDNVFRRLQLVSAAAYSLGHGSNDAQKSMGIIFAALIAAGHLTKNDTIPFWVVISCQAAMAIGTLMGGWRIVKTMGQRITQLALADKEFKLSALLEHKDHPKINTKLNNICYGYTPKA